MSQSRPFSKLKKQVEALFAPGLDLRVDCFVHAHRTQYSEVRVPRYMLRLDDEPIWRFPGGFPVEQETPHMWPYMLDISGLLRAYMDTPLAELLTSEIPGEHVVFGTDPSSIRRGDPQYDFRLGLAPLLIAADRRIGRERLAEWAAQWPQDHAVHRILKAREEVRAKAVPAR